MKEETTNQTIRFYLDKLIEVYGLYPIVNEAALKIQFDHGLYAECVLEIMRKMGLQNKVKVKCYADYKYPHAGSAAVIYIPRTLPNLGSKQFNAMRLNVEMTASIKKHFYSFVSSMAHELSHVVLHGTKHVLHKSEVATDLCVLVFGFQNFMIKGKRLEQWTVLGNEGIELGYLSYEQLHYAVSYLNDLRKIKSIKPQAPRPKSSLENLIDLIKRKLF